MAKKDRDIEKGYSNDQIVENSAVWPTASNPARILKSPSRANESMFPRVPNSPSNTNVTAATKNWNSDSNGTTKNNMQQAATQKSLATELDRNFYAVVTHASRAGALLSLAAGASTGFGETPALAAVFFACASLYFDHKCETTREENYTPSDSSMRKAVSHFVLRAGA